MKILITESQYQKLVENIEIIDDILDKLGKIGYENLENSEKMTLNKYSEWLNSGKKGEFMTQNDQEMGKWEAKIGEKYTTYLEDGSKFSFRFDYEDMLDDENLYYGSVNWHGEEWIGLIATDKKGNLTEIDFVLDQDSFQTYDSDDDLAGYDDSKEKRLTDELKDQGARVKYFFEEEVIPTLMD